MNTITLEKTEKITFTTHRKKPKTTINISRKGSVVKERCKQLCEVALGLFPDRVVPDVDLKDLVMMYIGADKETVRSYCGYYGHIRQGKMGESQTIGLARKGYLELLGLAHKIGHGKWVIHSQVTLQEPVKDDYTYRESVGCGFDSKEKISLSPSGVDDVEGQALEERKGVANNELEEALLLTNNNYYYTTEKERFFTPKICPKISDPDAYLKVLADAGRKEAEK